MSIKVTKKVIDGIKIIDNFSTWNEFSEFICEKMLDYQYFIWRGQRGEKWKLEPTLDRILKGINTKKSDKIRKAHLDKFKLSCRSRRGNNPPYLNDNENNWWALGQHYGLATLLLDWTKSPFVAAFFTFEKDNTNISKNRMIFGISRLLIQNKCEEIKNNFSGQGRPPIVEFIEPLSDENTRLVSQGGLFTRTPDGIDLESWIKENFKNFKERTVMFKISLPEKERSICLRSLNRMNINHLSLFPDLYGASKFTNLDLTIANY